LCCSYQKILFFEEAFYYGGISQMVGDCLLQHGYHGIYQRIAPKQFIPQATTASQLEQIGLSETAMLRTIRELAQENIV
jgi:deoxyxylulose-5-phosphate synthase